MYVGYLSVYYLPWTFILLVFIVLDEVREKRIEHTRLPNTSFSTIINILTLFWKTWTNKKNNASYYTLFSQWSVIATYAVWVLLIVEGNTFTNNTFFITFVCFGIWYVREITLAIIQQPLLIFILLHILLWKTVLSS